MEESCHTIEAMLAGYALDALDLDESRRVEAHLETCPDCRKALADFQAVGDGLLFALPPQEPPARLRARLLKATIPASTRTSDSLLWHGWQKRLLPISAMVTLVVLAVMNIGLLQNTKRLLQKHESLVQQNQAYQTAFSLLTYPDTQVAVIEDEDLIGTFLFDPDDQVAVLTVRGLEALPAGQVYQLWLIEPDQTRVSGGIFQSEGGQGYSTFVVQSPTRLDSFMGIGVTIEPAGGSPGPTGPRVLGVQF